MLAHFAFPVSDTRTQSVIITVMAICLL